MSKYLHNNTEDPITINGREIPAGSIFLIPQGLYSEYADCTLLASLINSDDVTVSADGINPLSSPESMKEFLQTVEPFRSCLAVDKDGTHQSISGTTPTVITRNRTLWDFNGDYDNNTDDLVIPVDGVYSFDIQLRVNNFTNCSSVEIALYKRGDPDDYWFILDKKEVGSSSFLQLKNSTLFDFYKDERYYVAIILEKVDVNSSVSCDIVGDDDYTAWGYNFIRNI